MRSSAQYFLILVIMKFQVFLIDDDYDDQEVFRMALLEIDPEIEFTFAQDGIVAMEKLSDLHFPRPDYIFIDINMHKLDGRECLQLIKKIDYLKSSRIIMFSTSSEPEIVRECMELGADEFLVKPPGLEALVVSLRNLFNKS